MSTTVEGYIEDVEATATYLIIATNRGMKIFDHTHRTSVGEVPIGDWDPSGLACREDGKDLSVYVGLSRRHKGTLHGRIKVYRLRDGTNDRLSSIEPSRGDLPNGDLPKRLSLTDMGRKIACVTEIHNKVLVWDLDEHCRLKGKPFEFQKNRTTSVSLQFPIRPLSEYSTSSPK